MLYAKEKSEKKKAKEWNVRKKELKEGLMTKSDWLKILQQLVLAINQMFKKQMKVKP